MTKEFLQLHTREAFGPLIGEDVTEKKKDVLKMLMFLKGQCNRKIKAGDARTGESNMKNMTMMTQHHRRCLHRKC